MEKIYTNNILPFMDHLNSKLYDIGKLCFPYKSTISFKDLFYIMYKVNSGMYGYSVIMNDLVAGKEFDVTKSSIIQKRSKCDNTYFKQINDYMANFIYKDVQHRLLAADSTILYGPAKLKSEGVGFCQNGKCCKLLLGGLFDVNTKIAINYMIGNKNERALLKQQMCILKLGDIVLHDRGYYSMELLYLYHISKADAIFRMIEN